MAKEIHVVMLPWLAFGHLIPFFQLSIALAKQGLRISFVSTPNNIKRLPKIPPELAPLIEYVEIPITSGILPEGAEATVDVLPEQIQHLKVAYDLLAQPFKQLVSDRSPDWIIVDLIPHWAVDTAEEYGVPLILFSVLCAATLVFFGPPEYLTGDGQKREKSSPESLTMPPKWVNFPSSVAYRKYEATVMHAGFYGENVSEFTDAQRISKICSGCHAIAVRTCREFEGNYLNLLEKILGKPAIPVGLLPPVRTDEREIADDKWNWIFKWLDKQNPKSVVFVGFGSEYKLTKEQVYEIAHGLEASELPFLWALGKPSWANDDSDALPSKFRQRTIGKGLVHIGWTPQKEILAHPSIGCSLFHSGWGSVIENLQHGHCLVVLPFIIDQGLNARLLVEKGLALEVKRREDGSFSGKDIAESLKKLSEKSEKEVSMNTRKAALVFADEKLNQDHYIGGFVQFLKDGVRTKESKIPFVPEEDGV